MVDVLEVSLLEGTEGEDKMIQKFGDSIGF